MQSIKLTESELRELVLEEFDKMVEDGEIDEGALGRAWTQAKGAVSGQAAKLGTDLKRLGKKGGQAFASALGADKTAAELGGQADDLKAQATQKQLVAKAKAALKPLGAAYSDFAQNAQAMGILELPAMQQAARGLQGAIATINQAIEAAPAQQQPEQGPEATGDEPEPGQPGSTQAAMLNQMDATDDQLAAQGSSDAQQRVTQRQTQEQDWIARGRPSRAGVPQYRTIDQIEAGEGEQDV